VNTIKLVDIRESLAKIFCKLGLRDVDAIILAELIIEDRGMTVIELKSSLNYSISGITAALHRLMRLYLVTRKKREKKYVYQSESNILSILLHLIWEIKNHDVQDLKRKIEIGIQNLPKKKDKIEKLRERVEKAEKYLQALLNLLSQYEEVIS